MELDKLENDIKELKLLIEKLMKKL